MNRSEQLFPEPPGTALSPARIGVLLQPETQVIALAWLAAILVALVLAALKGVPSPLRILFQEVFDDSSRNWYWVGAVLPTNLVALAAARDSREGWRIFAVATAVALGGAAFSTAFYDIKTALYFGSKCCAIFGMLALLSQVRRHGGAERLFVAVMFATYLAIRLSYLPLTYMMRADTFDLFTFSFDNSLGFNVAAWLFSAYHRFRPVAATLNAVYVFVLLLPLSLYAAQIHRHDPQTSPMLRVFIMATGLGFFCYLIFPVSGPLYFIGSGLVDHKLLTGTPHVVEFRASWRNGMPSVHFAIALLMALNVPRSMRKTQLAFFAFCGLTALATMANGEHYLADLLAALPFVCAVQGFCLWLNAPRAGRRYLLAGIRSLLVFAGFLAFLLAAPESMRIGPFAWGVVTLLIVHFISELRGWRRPRHEHADPAAPCLR